MMIVGIICRPGHRRHVAGDSCTRADPSLGDRHPRAFSGNRNSGHAPVRIDHRLRPATTRITSPSSFYALVPQGAGGRGFQHVDALQVATRCGDNLMLLEDYLLGRCSTRRRIPAPGEQRAALRCCWPDLPSVPVVVRRSRRE